MTTGRPYPVRMCAVAPTDDGRWQAFCIACSWQARTPSASKTAAENKAKRHQCPRPKYN